ncbi:MAG: hypothetical protein OXE42_15565 [Gammaproteobacteria bacterium]|nr:hypothetical protein [Gammaproteobacteria bacterium]
MSEPLFLSLNSIEVAKLIRTARRSVCFAAPGILQEPAKAMVDVAARIGPELVTVCLDFDEKVMRMGFGEMEAVNSLRKANIEVRTVHGMRTGLVIVDGEGYIFTPTALYLEAEHRPIDAPNAMRLSQEQAKEALARLSPVAKAIAAAHADTEEERERICEQAVEVPSEPVADQEIKEVERRLTETPPVQFDIERQVRVYSSYLQYIELELKGAALQRRRLTIPQSVLELDDSEELQDRLRTTFEVIEKNSHISWSSERLENNLNWIRDDLTKKLPNGAGRIVLKSEKPQLDKRLEEFRNELEQHRELVWEELRETMEKALEQIVKYYLPRIMESPPDDLYYQIGRDMPAPPSIAREWLDRKLKPVFKKAFDRLKSDVEKMQIIVRYKDVTYETLNREDFLQSVRKEYPYINWDRAHEEYRAAGEKI